MDDVDKYLKKRFKKNPKLEKSFWDGYEKFKVGVLLKEARMKSGMTQEEVANKLNTTKSVISRIENHADNITISTLEKFAKAVGKDIRCLLTIEDKKNTIKENMENFQKSRDNLDNITEELRNEKENLEETVIKRTSELSAANEKLKSLDKLKINFFANISHELRTPLTLILSPIESALQGDYKKDIDGSFLKNIQRNAIRLLGLVNNLLDFSKIEAGRMSMKIREIDIVKVLNNYIEVIHSSAESRGISIDLTSESDSLNLFLDLEKIDKIAMNLFSNALKFTEKNGEIMIRIKDDDRNCYIEFEDTGVGIPSERMDSIFDRFSQAYTGSTRRYEGTGIGLALAKELVEMQGGSISVKSKYTDNYPDDHGTTFTVAFPKGKEHLEGIDGVEFITESKLAESVSDHRFIGIREMIDIKEAPHEGDSYKGDDSNRRLYMNRLHNILIVEDNSDMSAFLKSLLKDRYNVHIAVNGEDGLNKAKEIKPDLIVTDVMMPLMNGYEMTKEIKEDEEFKRTPVLMLTAKADISHKIEGLEYGADDYLTKPFNSKELLARIKSLLKIHEYEKETLERNIIIEDELKTARLLQQKLLPEKLPEVSGYNSHVTYIPMDKVGGDFYDCKANNDIVELFIADVSGHGLPGAFLSMITKMAFESIRNRNSTKNALYIINDVICKSTVESNYVTTFYCIIDRETNIMSYSNAGHFPPLIYRQENDEFFELRAKGNPLGWFKSLKLEEKEIQLNAGDRLLLYTDGITECMDSNREEFGEEGFKEFIRSNIGLSPKQFSESLLTHLKEISGSDRFDDDLCLVVFDVI